MSSYRFSPFVRSEMIPPSEPPAGESGILRWMRQNLFSSTLNIVLTLLALVTIWWVLAHTLPWMLRGIWSARSLTECRAIRDQLYPTGTSAACWAVISDRWKQLLFGFYPPEAYWRVILALALFLLAIAPILFTTLSRRLLWFTLISPLLMFYLLWGGSLWGPLTVSFGFVLGWALYVLVSPKSTLAGVIAALLGPLVWWLVFSGPLAAQLSQAMPLGLMHVPSQRFGGFMLSFIIGISGIVLSLPLGILLALGRQSDMPIIHMISVGFIEIIRGVPLIVWLFTASLLLNYFLPPGTNFDLMLRVIIMVTLFSSAYIAEVVRGGLAALPRGQYEAADALGLNYWKSMRLIVLPQALKISIPGIVNTFIGLFKDTTLVVFIGLLDPIGLSNSIRAHTDWNGVYWEIFIFIGLMFFICCYAMSRYSQYLERKLRREYR